MCIHICLIKVDIHMDMPISYLYPIHPIHFQTYEGCKTVIYEMTKQEVEMMHKWKAVLMNIMNKGKEGMPQDTRVEFSIRKDR